VNSSVTRHIINHAPQAYKTPHNKISEVIEDDRLSIVKSFSMKQVCSAAREFDCIDVGKQHMNDVTILGN
jgi:hypothetical protein